MFGQSNSSPFWGTGFLDALWISSTRSALWKLSPSCLWRLRCTATTATTTDLWWLWSPTIGNSDGTFRWRIRCVWSSCSGTHWRIWSSFHPNTLWSTGSGPQWRTLLGLMHRHRRVDFLVPPMRQLDLAHPLPPPSGFGGFGAPAPSSAFGTGSAFGVPAPAPATGGLFGAPAQSAFGAPAPSAFGTQSVFGAPGQAPSLFGSPPAPIGGIIWCGIGTAINCWSR